MQKSNKKLLKRNPFQYEITEERKIIRQHSRLLALNLMHYRKRHRITQKMLSEKTGISQTVISYLESGWANPSLLYLVKIAEYYKISIADLFIK